MRKLQSCYTERIMGNLYKCLGPIDCPERKEPSSAMAYCGKMLKYEPSEIEEMLGADAMIPPDIKLKNIRKNL